MKITPVKSTNFRGDIRTNLTAKTLIKSADGNVKAKLVDIFPLMLQKNDHLLYTFAHSSYKRNGKDFFHVSLIEEDTRNSGYSIVRQTIEIPGKYASIVDACTKNKNLLEKFIKFFSNKYEAQLNNKILDYEKIRDVYKIKKGLF